MPRSSGWWNPWWSEIRIKIGDGKNVFFTVMGQKDDGSNYVQSFRFLNKRTAKKLQKELVKLTGLQMGQIKSSG